MQSHILWGAFSVFLLLASSVGAQEEAFFAVVEQQGKKHVGIPLGWDGKQFALYRRDGWLDVVPADSRDDLQLTTQPFVPWTNGQLATALSKKYGDRYDVSTTEHYVVVHPWGDHRTWADPFEHFLRAFESFMEGLGMEVEPPKVPLIVTVLRSRADFDLQLFKDIEIHDQRIAGYYSEITNRITTCDPGGYIREKEDRWLYSAWPIIHEATHQSAFNTGAHNRFAPPPKWLSEALATLFEAPGYYDPTNHPNALERVNVHRLASLRKYLNSESLHAGFLNLVANDRLFQSHPELAYALSWGMGYYLAEEHPEKLAALMDHDRKRKNFTEYPSQQRLKDFVEVVGSDFETFEKDLNSYFSEKLASVETPAPRPSHGQTGQRQRTSNGSFSNRKGGSQRQHQ